MQALYYAARGNLRWFMRLHPEWSQSQLAYALGMSRSPVAQMDQTSAIGVRIRTSRSGVVSGEPSSILLSRWMPR